MTEVTKRYGNHLDSLPDAFSFKEGEVALWHRANTLISSSDGEAALFAIRRMQESDMHSATALLGVLYEVGSGNIAPDIRKAIAHYQESIEQVDDLTSHVALARIYLFPEKWVPIQPDGDGEVLQGKIDPDFELGHYHLDLLVSTEYAPAYWVKGMTYLQGKGVVADEHLVRQWFEKGAATGNLMARLLLAQMDRGCSLFARLNYYRLAIKFSVIRIFKEDDPSTNF